MTSFFASPFNIDAAGFCFETLDEFATRAARCLDAFGNVAEEFDIEFIQGDEGDARLFSALKIGQATLCAWFDSVEGLSIDQKAALHWLCADAGRTAEEALAALDDVVLREGSLADSASELFDELYPDLPSAVRAYIDEEAFARDLRLNGDLAEFEHGGRTFTGAQRQRLVRKSASRVAR